MNYINQINVFWKLDAEHSFNGNESRLYFYLLELSNSLYWKNPLTNADGYTASRVGISVNTLKTCRNRLQQAGLIKFKPGGNGARDKCIYEILEAGLVLSKVSKSDTLPDTRYQNLTPYPQPYHEPYPQPYQQNADDIIKHKLEETKPNERVTPSPVLSPTRPPHAPAWKSVYEIFYRMGKPDEAITFFNHYEGLGWEVNGSKIKHVDSFVSKWLSNDISKKQSDNRNAGITETDRDFLKVFGLHDR